MALKYKAGDRVRIKDIDWFNNNKNNKGAIVCGSESFIHSMSHFCDKVVTIVTIQDDCYRMFEDDGDWYWTDEMIEGLVEEKTKPNIIEEAKTYWDSIKDAWICPDGYTFKDEKGNIINATKIVLEKKKMEYPKTYEDCLKILGFTTVYTPKVEPMFDYDDDIIALQKLKNCRNAYWKIAGEEMGLGKPWKPDYDSGVDKFGIICLDGVVQESNPTTNWERHLNKVLDFPTREMRDAFYEIFKESIEQCKELL